MCVFLTLQVELYLSLAYNLTPLTQLLAEQFITMLLIAFAILSIPGILSEIRPNPKPLGWLFAIQFINFTDVALLIKPCVLLSDSQFSTVTF